MPLPEFEDYLSEETKQKLADMQVEMTKKFPGSNGPQLDPIADMSQKLMALGKALEKSMGTPPTYRLRYHHLFNLGNFENEAVDLEREFPASVSPVLALKQLKIEVETMNEMLHFSKKLSIIIEDGPLGEINILQSMVDETKQNLEKLQKQLKEKTKDL